MTNQSVGVPGELMVAADQLISSAFSGWRGQLLYVLTELGVMDVIGESPGTADEIATRVGADAVALERCLLAGVALDLIEQEADGRYSAAKSAWLLRSDVAGSVRPIIRFAGSRFVHAIMGDLLTAVRTGTSSVQRTLGTENLYEYLEGSPAERDTFDAGMAAITQMAAPLIADAYDFDEFAEVVDVGGGRGHLLVQILTRYPRVKGTLFDLPSVVAGAPAVLDAANLNGRINVVGGSMYDDIPSGAPCYVLKNVLHNWDDENCAAILRQLRAVVPPDGRLLVIEAVHGSTDDAPSTTTAVMDLCMMATWGARERSRAEWSRLFDESGFRLTREIPVMPWLSILEVQVV